MAQRLRMVTLISPLFCFSNLGLRHLTRSREKPPPASTSADLKQPPKPHSRPVHHPFSKFQSDPQSPPTMRAPFAGFHRLGLHGCTPVIHRNDRFLTGLPSSMLFDFPFPVELQAHLLAEVRFVLVPSRRRRLRRCLITPKAQSISVPVPNAYLVQETGGKNTFRYSPATLHHPYHCVPLEPVFSRSATDQVKTTRAMPGVHIRDKKPLMAGPIVGLLVNSSAFLSDPTADPIFRRTSTSPPDLRTDISDRAVTCTYH